MCLAYVLSVSTVFNPPICLFPSDDVVSSTNCLFGLVYLFKPRQILLIALNVCFTVAPHVSVLAGVFV